jgi:CDP-glucose 4,6-dehydratase
MLIERIGRFGMIENSPQFDGWGGKRVLVTGATGLVGSRLVEELLLVGADVNAFVADEDPQSLFFRSDLSKNTRIINGRLERYDDVERALNNTDPEVVFHLGAQPIVGVANRLPRHTFETNIQGTWNILDACRQLSGRISSIVVASSDKAYGAGALPYREDTPLQGEHPYDVSKSCTDLLARSYYVSYQLPVTIARCGNIYGPGDLNWNRLIPGTIRSVWAGSQPVIRSDGSYKRDYIHVDDVVSAYLSLAQNISHADVTGNAFNFSNDSPYTVIEIAEKILEIMGATGAQLRVENSARNEIRDQYLDSTRARSVLGWKPRIDLGDGLRKTVAWYCNFLDHEAK